MRYTIFDEMRRMQEQMDSMFNNFFWDNDDRKLLSDDGEKSVTTSNYRNPVCDTWETDKDVVTEVELPGVDKKDIKVNVNEDGIEVRTESKQENKVEDKKKGMYKLERSYSGFYRKFALPKNVDANKAQAEYKNGILRIKVPKLKIEKKKQKMLDIK